MVAKSVLQLFRIVVNCVEIYNFCLENIHIKLENLVLVKIFYIKLRTETYFCNCIYNYQYQSQQFKVFYCSY